MPEISRFYGIVVQMYFGDHPPPHFHARYSGHNAKIDIDTLAVIEGQLPPRALGLVTEWAVLHQASCATHSRELQICSRRERLNR
jgi:hypothetical protein